MPDLHPSLAPLATLVGTWRGRGQGDYPTIEPFDYLEEITFGHVGKPFLAYVQRTRNPADDLPMHAEAGYLRPGPDDASAELVIAQPTGVTEVHTGTVADEDGRLVVDLRCDDPRHTPTARNVTVVRRRLVVTGDELHQDLWMGFDEHPETHHLTATLRRQDGS